MITYRTALIDRLTKRAIALQNLNRWEEADNLLTLAIRWEALWESLEEKRKW